MMKYMILAGTDWTN